MTIEKSVGKMTVKGLIKSVEDSALFKDEMYSAMDPQFKRISIHIVDSFIVTSSIIGSMLKAINIDKANIELYVYQSDLFQLLEQLKLIEALSVKRAKAL